MSSLEQRLITPLIAAGFARFRPHLMISADIVRHVSGEELSGKLFITQDEEGNELALRHDYTLPLTLHFLKSGAANAKFSYLGPVFRQNKAHLETLQGGAESFGREDIAAADADILTLAVNGTKAVVTPKIRLKMGDIALFLALVKALNLPAAWQRRVVREFRGGKPLTQDITTKTSYAGLLAALEGQDASASKALVLDILNLSGIKSTSGRTAEEIAERFLEQASLASAPLNKAALAILSEALTLQGHPDDVLAKLRDLASKHNLNIAPALERFEARNGFLEAQGIDLNTIHFALNFAREPDYYNGLVFEIYGQGEKPLAGGGRYDKMSEMVSAILGQKRLVPAVGFAWFIENFSGE